MSVTIRPAETAELKRIAGFLPSWHRIDGDECLVAETTSPTRLVGLSLLGRRPGDDGQPLTYLDVGVLPRFRDAGVIEQLVSAQLESARRFDDSEIFLATPRRKTAPDFARLEQLGFEEYRSLILYEFSLPDFVERAVAAYDRLLKRASIPPNAQVAGLTPIHWPAAVQLLRSEKLMDAPTQARAERAGLHLYYSPASSVVMLDGELKGVVLNQANGRQMETSALAVDPKLRGGAGWVNAMLSWRVATVGPALGYETLTMSADPVRHPMTTRLAQRMKANELHRDLLLKRPLTKTTHL